MSSPNSETKGPTPGSRNADGPDRRLRDDWGLWRKLMLAGSLVLLANALAVALMKPDPPRPVQVIATSVGFVLMAVGFGQRMRGRGS